MNQNWWWKKGLSSSGGFPVIVNMPIKTITSPPRIFKPIYFYNEYSRSSIDQIIVPFLVHSWSPRDDLAVLCQKWVSIIRIIQERNEAELGCWKNKLYWRPKSLGRPFFYNSPYSFLIFYKCVNSKHLAIGEHQISPEVPATSETIYPQGSDLWHCKKTLMRGYFNPQCLVKMLCILWFLYFTPISCFSKLPLAFTSSQIHFPS